ncbi:MAG: hypothetical protein JWO45_1364 [Spartobacteria bacterium]|nr:hypothetical protein [Spartobacteria bacterium]
MLAAMVNITTMEALLTLVLLGGFVGALASVLFLNRQRSRPAQFAWKPFQHRPVPFRRRSFLLFSAAERSLYKVLRSLVPDHMIFVKVRLDDLVSIKPSGHSFWEHFSPVHREHIDFIVCDQTLAPVVAIELDKPRPIGDAPVRDRLVDAVLASASLPVLHISEKKCHVFSELRGLLAPYLRVPAPMI